MRTRARARARAFASSSPIAEREIQTDRVTPDTSA